MTVDSLKDCNKKELARLAKEHGIVGWHAMRKDQLIKALASEPPSPPNGNGHVDKATRAKASGNGHHPVAVSANGTNGHADHGPGKSAAKAGKSAPAAANGKAKASAARGEPAVEKPKPEPMTLPSRRLLDHSCEKDRIITVVRDPYWLHAYWELSRSTLDRAKAAMGQDWHTARPILRLMDVTSEDTTAASEQHVRDIEIHSEVNNWYIDVTSPPRSFRVDIGYLARRGTFYVLARSNVATTPKARISEWPDGEGGRRPGLPVPGEYESNNAIPRELRDLFEERMHHPVHHLAMGNLAVGPISSFGRDFRFQIDAELVVYGATEPNARVTLQGEPVKIRPDGTFSVRFNLPDSRQIIPAVAASPDGVEERTIVLAVERNTKTLEPQIHDCSDL